MIFEDFKKHVDVLSEDESNVLRELFIARFIDTSKENYKKYIANRRSFSDGYCYTGYLWDYLQTYNIISMKSLIDELSSKGIILVLWDIHSCERIYIENYWKFQKDRVLKFDVKYLNEGIEYLPEDIYIFDYDFCWTYIITHEDDGKRRICLKAF